MNCRRVEPRLLDHLERLVPEREARAIEAHLAHCPACRQRQERFQALRAGLRELARHLPARETDVYEQAVGRGMAERAASAGNGRRRRAPSVSLPAVGRDDRQAWIVWAAGVIALSGAAAALCLSLLLSSRAGHGRIAGSPQRQLARGLARTPTGGPLPAARTPITSGEDPIAGPPPAAPPGSHDLPRPPGAPAGGGDPEAAKGGGLQTSPLRPSAPIAGDLPAINRDPQEAVRQWATLTRSEWEEIEDRLRKSIRVRDDFVTIPFPRLASTSDRQIAHAVESYKREAAIVDPRLSHEVTGAFKASALSDLCS